MRKRPLCLISIFVIAWMAVSGLFGGDNASPDNHVPGMQVRVTGELEKQETSSTSNVLYLKNNSYLIQSDSKLLKYSTDRKIIVYPKTKENYKIGNILTVTGEYAEAEASGNPGQFDMIRYYKTKGIQFSVKKAIVKITDPSSQLLGQWLFSVREKFKYVFIQILGTENASILSAMLLGEKKDLDPDVKKLYQDNGIAHILAISGLHISLLGMGLYQLLRKTGLPLLICLIFSGIFMTLYGMMTGFGISTKRAVIMFLVYLLGKLFGRTYDILSALALASLLILFTEKEALYDAGFLLSFLAVLGVAAVAPKLKELTGKGSCKIWNTLSVSLAVQYTTVPIVLYFFFVIPLYGILLNLMVIPLMSLVLVFGIAGGLAGIIFIPLGIFAAAPCGYILNFYNALCEFVIRLPSASVIIGQPKFWQMGVYFTGLILLCIIKIKKRKLNWMKWAIGSFLMMGILLYRPNNLLKIVFLDVGQGDGIFLQTPSGNNFFIDGGSSSVANIAKMRIEPYLKSQGVGVLDYYFLSHLDEDHMNGLKEMLTNYKQNIINKNAAGITIKNLVLPKLQEKDEAYLELVNLAVRNHIGVIYFEKGNRMTDGDALITCLHPTEYFESQGSNAASMVLEITYGNFRVLMTGDVEGAGEDALEKGKMLKDIDVLKVAHHGSKNSTSEEFLDLVKPEYAIISCGKNNRYGHPHQELTERLEKVKSRYLLTCDSGAVSVYSDGEGYEILSYR